jgi:hypothetical protein
VIGRRHSERVWIDDEVWESRAEYDRVQKLAVAITGTDVLLIDKLVRHTEDAARRGRPDMVTGYHWDTERRRQDLVRGLFERAGAAMGADDDCRTIPLTVAEIKQLRQIRHDIQYFTGYYLCGKRDPLLDAADDLLNRLAMAVGHAKATGEAQRALRAGGAR